MDASIPYSWYLKDSGARSEAGGETEEEGNEVAHDGQANASTSKRATRLEAAERAGAAKSGADGLTDPEPAGVGETCQQEKTVDHGKNNQQIAPPLREGAMVSLSRHDA